MPGKSLGHRSGGREAFDFFDVVHVLEWERKEFGDCLLAWVLLWVLFRLTT